MLEILGYIIAGVLVVICLLLAVAALPLYSKESPLDVVESIDRFLQSGRDDREYDEFLCIRAKDETVNTIKAQLRDIDDSYGSDAPPHYLTEAGIEAVRAVARSIRSSAA